MIPSPVFVPAVALKIKFSLSSKFLRNLRSMPQTCTHVLSTSIKHTTGFLVKSSGQCCGSTVLTAACYWPSSHCIPAQKFVSVSGEFTVGVGLRQRCVVSPLLFIVYIRGHQTFFSEGRIAARLTAAGRMQIAKRYTTI